MRFVYAIVLFFAALFPACASQGGEWSLTLEEAIAFALDYNFTLQIRIFAEKEGQARFRQAWGRFLPNIDLTGEKMRSPIGSPTGSSIDTSRIVVDGRQIIFDGDALYTLIERSRENEALCYNVEAFIDNLLYAVRSAYYLVVVSRENIAILEENVELLADQVREEAAKLLAGSSTPFFVEQARVAAANAVAELHRAKKRFKKNQSDLAKLMGLNGDRASLLFPAVKSLPLEKTKLLLDKLSFLQSGGSPDLLFSPAEKEWWQEKMLLGRSDLKEERALLRAKESEVKRRYAEFFPRVEGFARYNSLSENSLETLFAGGKTSFWETGISFTWNLFDGLSKKNRVEEAKMSRCRQMANYRKRYQEATLELQERFNDIEETLQAYLSTSLGSRVAAKGVERAIGQSEEGLITPLEYRDAVRQLREARQKELVEGYQLLVSYFALLRDTGFDRAEGRLFRERGEVIYALPCCEVGDGEE